jgi:small-conductance mechanosensitive channel
MSEALIPVAAGLATIVAGLAALYVIRLTLRRAARRNPALYVVSRRAKRPVQFAVIVAGAHVTLAGLPDEPWQQTARHVLNLINIGTLAWLVGALFMIVLDLALPRYRTDVQDNWHARRVHTQVNVIRRVGVVALAVVAIGAMLLTFPAFRAAGASVLASAGIAGVIAGFAAQSLLSNVIAGMQLVFSEALHLDDVVVVEEEWGRVEEITLTYVVVRVWDDRRLILPTSYFMNTPFENWTRNQAAVLGTVELDLDWSVPTEPMREELEQALKENERWDGRVGMLQVTDATGSFVRVRTLVSAADAPTLWDLRCDVRERLVHWVREHHPEALPRMRADAAILDDLPARDHRGSRMDLIKRELPRSPG